MSPFWGRYPFSSEVPVTFSLSFSLSFVSLYSTSLEACQSPPGPQGCNSHAAPIPSVILTQGDLFNREIQTLSLPGVKSFSDSHHLLRKIQILGLHSWPVMRQLLPVFISCLNWTVFAEHHAVPCLCTCCSCCMQCPTPPSSPMHLVYSLPLRRWFRSPGCPWSPAGGTEASCFSQTLASAPSVFLLGSPVLVCDVFLEMCIKVYV